MAGRSAQTVNNMPAYIYISIKEKEWDTKVDNLRNLTGEYTLDDTSLGTVKIRPQEDSIRLLKGPTRYMAKRSAQTVKNLPAYICMDRGEGAEHRQQQQRSYLTIRIHP